MAFEGLSEKLSAAFKRLKQKGKLDEKDVKTAMREVRLALLEADVNYKVTKQFVSAVTERAVGAAVFESLTPAQQVIKIVHEELINLMGSEVSRLQIPSKGQCVIMMCGLQGSGKTTHSGKLAKLLKGQGHRPLLVACDVYRPAAIKQLQVVGEQAGVPVFEMGQIDPVEIAKKALAHARDYGNDIVILDTAGRLHIDEQLMGELENIKSAVDPSEILLVIDAMTGQDAVNVAQSFNDLLEITGVVLTKLDGDTRGGAALSVKAVTGKPIKFSGTGEKLDDLEPFYPDRMASRILGMGDVLTFIEKAQEQFDEKQQQKMEEKLRQNKFDLQDMLEQLEQINKMGSMQQIMGMMPGGMGAQMKDADIDERQIDRTRAIILSMTPQERAKPKLINPARKRRIAAGSGTKVEDVNRLLKQFEQMSKLIRQFTRPGKRRRRFMPF
ncbi:signal recognition particle protein [Neobittarella massiliensis]|uniref:Signal recognition particle protein n=2 Tax=Oscillospiraceae TaxID=216572 RepID=A0A8J6LZL6_9FIRM|nr:signal recognition particle protein [Neobittarella massiliensis]MBC3517037.1 signal recognition particle protein [Neobittarella massiliensis]SCJ89636.1 Fifty-four homolog [uncultured Anaerotruncus sp.]